jgi:hypothetical protein
VVDGGLHSKACFYNNLADQRGGAIMVEQPGRTVGFDT